MYTRGNQSTIYCLYIRKTSGLYRHRDLKPCVFGLHFRREDAGKSVLMMKGKRFLKKEKKQGLFTRMVIVLANVTLGQIPHGQSCEEK